MIKKIKNLFQTPKKWLEKKLIKTFIINKVIKKLPTLKDRIEGYWEAYSDDVFEKIVQKAEEYIQSKV